MKPRLNAPSDFRAPVRACVRPRALLHLVVCAALVAGAAGCTSGTPSQPASLKTPRAFTVARGPVCMQSVSPSAGVVRADVSACPDGQRGAIGLVANQTGNSISVVDMSRDNQGSSPAHPRLVDLDPSIPGVTGIAVGDSPVDVAASNGTTAYAINQADSTVSVIDLWHLRALAPTIQFDSAPVAVAMTPASDSDPGQVAVALSNPSRLWTHEAVDCSCAADVAAADCTPAHVTCDPVPSQATGHTVSLPGTVSRMVVGPAGDRLYVVYLDTSYASVFAMRDSALSDFPDGCLDGGNAPCEVARVGLTFGCSDGVDNDGDGKIDQQDPQCYGPKGSESPDGIGRAALGACSNGQDDDGDGKIDRADPDCLVSGADSEEQPIVSDAVLACNDTLDNDNDGKIDYPADDACYGSVGQSEQAITPVGYTDAAIDPFGKFLYVDDRANDQISGRRRPAPRAHRRVQRRRAQPHALCHPARHHRTALAHRRGRAGHAQHRVARPPAGPLRPQRGVSPRHRALQLRRLGGHRRRLRLQRQRHEHLL